MDTMSSDSSSSVTAISGIVGLAALVGIGFGAWTAYKTRDELAEFREAARTGQTDADKRHAETTARIDAKFGEVANKIDTGWANLERSLNALPDRLAAALKGENPKASTVIKS